MAQEERRQKPLPIGSPTSLTFGPWPKGIVNTVSEHALPMDALVDARDCNIDSEGFVYARNTYAVLDNTNPFQYLFELNGVSYAVSQGYVGILGASSFDTIYPVTGPVGWTEMEGRPVFCDTTGVYQIEGNTASQFVVRPTLEEEERYDLVTMPGGTSVAYWQGRLLVLRGKSLLWSEPLDYGCHSQARNFIRFPTTPTWMAALSGGVYVGLRDTVVFLSGTNPTDFTQRTVAGLSCPRAVLVIESPLTEVADGFVAVWMSDVGFVVGTAEGRVVYPQEDYIEGLPIVPRNLAYIDDRIYAFTTQE
jgi:hypothetical protein